MLRFGAQAERTWPMPLEIPLPVYRYSTPEVVATAGQLDEDGQRLEAVVLPPSYDPTQGELTVQLDPSLAAGMVDGLKYLEHYPLRVHRADGQPLPAQRGHLPRLQGAGTGRDRSWRRRCRAWSAWACSGSTTSSTTTAAGAGGSSTSPIPS